MKKMILYMLLLIPLSIKSSAVVFDDPQKRNTVVKLFFSKKITDRFIIEAVHDGDIQTVQYLLLVGIQPTKNIAEGHSVYSYARSINQTEIVRLLKPYLEK